jgi:hypothetical protein
LEGERCQNILQMPLLLHQHLHNALQPWERSIPTLDLGFVVVLPLFKRNKAHAHSKTNFNQINRSTKAWLYCVKLVSLDLYETYFSMMLILYQHYLYI